MTTCLSVPATSHIHTLPVKDTSEESLLQSKIKRILNGGFNIEIDCVIGANGRQKAMIETIDLIVIEAHKKRIFLFQKDPYLFR